MLGQRQLHKDRQIEKGTGENLHPRKAQPRGPLQTENVGELVFPPLLLPSPYPDGRSSVLLLSLPTHTSFSQKLASNCSTRRQASEQQPR